MVAQFLRDEAPISLPQLQMPNAVPCVLAIHDVIARAHVKIIHAEMVDGLRSRMQPQSGRLKRRVAPTVRKD